MIAAVRRTGETGMTTATQASATLDDLLNYEGKAELIGGRIVPLASGHLPSLIAGEIFVSLRAHVRRTKVGRAYPDGTGFAQRPPLPSGRESFGPDAAYHTGPAPANPMKFVDGAPDFAAEVRSEGDYGPVAEAAMAFKRAEYFSAGTVAVWDVDPEAETVVLYRASDPATPVVFRRGDVAHAEPAVPGWAMPVDDVFA
jgi:Uma2 family endonuclease